MSLRKACRGITTNLIFTVIASVVFSSFQHGYNTGVVNAPQKLIENFINVTYIERHGVLPGDSTITLIFSILVSVYCVGGMIGALMTAYIADKHGLKKGLIFNNVFVFIGAGLMGFSKLAHSYEMIVLGRFFIGVNSGLCAGLAPMYLSEIVPVHLRGAMGTIYQLVITISILVSQLFGLPGMFGTEELWPVVLAVTAIPAVFMLATMPFCPESPKYLLVKQGNEEAAQSVLVWLRGTVEVYNEIDEMRAEYEALRIVPRVTLYEMWHNFALRQPLLIAVMVMLSQQFSGINAVIFYSTEIFLSAGLTAKEALNATLGTGGINVLITIISLILVERMGRRTLLLTGLAGMMVTTILMTICLTFKDDNTVFSHLSIVCLIAFVIMFAIGPGSIPWFLVTELFGQGARPLAASISVAVNWSANFIVSIAFLPLEAVLKNYVFVIFTILLALFWIFTYRKVPETRNRTTEEIAAEFRQNAYR